MRIKKIRLKNGYKRFFDLTIDLGDRPQKIIALVGPNGCGKSSVLDGMLFRSNPWGAIGNKGAKNHEYHSMHKKQGFDYQNVEIDFVEGSFEQVRAQKESAGKQMTIFSFRSPYRYNSALKVNETRATVDIKLNSYGATSSSDLDDKMEDNYRRLNIKYNKYLHDEDCTPSQAKQKIIGDLNSSIQKCLDLEIFSIGNVEASMGTLYFKKSDHPAEFEFNVLSSGEKEVVDILLDLYLRREDYDDTVFLLDEPELHINSSIQKKLLLEIDRLVGDKCQLWLTTHSIGFLRALQEELQSKCQVINFGNVLNLASASAVLTPIKSSVETWRKIFSIALDDLSHLVSPKQIIYCEGRDMPGSGGKERGMDAQAYNSILSSKYVNSLFISSGGNTELDQRSEIAISILAKVFPSVEILVLKDRDISSGKITTAAERILYLKNNPGNHRVLERWEIENYLYDKEVLKKYCVENKLTFDESAYDAFVTDIYNQNLKDETNRIKNYCGITTSINADKFKLSLARCVSEDMAVYKDLERCIFS